MHALGKFMRQAIRILFVLFISVFFIVKLVGYLSEEKPATSENPVVERSLSSKISVEVSPVPTSTPSSWEYSEQEDKMGKGKIIYAQTSSTNQFEFKFPYGGTQRATLLVRYTKGDSDVILKLERGQFVCGVSECFGAVRFGKGESTPLKFVPPSDHSSETLFVTDSPLSPGPKQFISKMKKVKTISIQTTIYNEGEQVFDFNVDGFAPPKKD